VLLVTLSIHRRWHTCESLTKSVSVRPDLTGVSVNAAHLDWVRTARHMNTVEFDVYVMETALTRNKVNRVTIYTDVTNTDSLSVSY